MTYEYVPKLIRAALNNDRKNIEAIALMLGRKLKNGRSCYVQQKLCVSLLVPIQELML